MDHSWSEGLGGLFWLGQQVSRWWTVSLLSQMCFRGFRHSLSGLLLQLKTSELKIHDVIGFQL